MAPTCLVHNLDTNVTCEICKSPICSYCSQEQKNPKVCLSCEKRELRQSEKEKEQQRAQVAKSSVIDQFDSTKPIVMSVICLLVILFFGYIVLANFSGSGKTKSRFIESFAFIILQRVFEKSLVTEIIKDPDDILNDIRIIKLESRTGRE